jgi:hypothetical protein
MISPEFIQLVKILSHMRPANAQDGMWHTAFALENKSESAPVSQPSQVESTVPTAEAGMSGNRTQLL